MFLKNYTSDVPVSQTIYRIEQVLIRCGVSGITKEYGAKGEVAAIQFHIKMDAEKGPVTVRLPADADGSQQALWLNYADGDKLTENGMRLAYSPYKKKTKADFREQAERTAWKIVQDWVEVQMSMIQLKQADFIQVFLPYVWDGNQTFYHALKERGFRGMLPEKCG